MADIERRSLLLGAAATVVVSSQIFGTSSASAASSSTLQHEGRLLYRFNRDFSSAVPWVAPGVIRLAGRVSSLLGELLRVSWDSRLADITSPTVFVAGGGKVHEVSGRVTAKGNAATLIVPLSPSISLNSRAEEWTFLPQIFPKAGLAEIGLDAVQETTVQLVGRSGLPSARAPRAGFKGRKDIDGAVWGGGLSVIWDGASDSGEASRFTYPRIVLLESVGPGPVPAGARITLTADANTVGALSCVNAKRDEETTISIRQNKEESADTAMLVLTLDEPLPRRSKARFELKAADEGTPSPSARVRSSCVISLDSGNGQPALQKRTGDESRALS